MEWYNSKNEDRVSILAIISEFVDDSPGGYQLLFPVKKNGTIASPYWPLPGNKRKYLKAHHWVPGHLTHKHGLRIARRTSEVAKGVYDLRRDLHSHMNELVLGSYADYSSAMFVRKIVDAHPNMKRLETLFGKISLLEQRVPADYTLINVRFRVQT